jgi:rhamnosyltransferase subunit B
MRMTQEMPVSRIVFATIGSLGDLHPKISLALELRARGYEVAIATHGEYRDRIEAIDNSDRIDS